MGNWTPGPWYVDQYGDIEANGESVANISGFYGEETNDANARLIAAAPDSHAANLATVAALDEAFGIQAIHDDDYIYDTLPSSGIARAYFMARAAIAAATGAK